MNEPKIKIIIADMEETLRFLKEDLALKNQSDSFRLGAYIAFASLIERNIDKLKEAL